MRHCGGQLVLFNEKPKQVYEIGPKLLLKNFKWCIGEDLRQCMELDPICPHLIR
jgi:hypothetical protein